MKKCGPSRVPGASVPLAMLSAYAATLGLLAVVIACLGLYMLKGARWLVVDEPHPADVILVLSGDEDRAHRAIELLREGYAPRVLIDIYDWTLWGAHTTDLARHFIASTAPEVAERIDLCMMQADSTRTEATAATTCLRRLHARSILLVTSDFHTRRALMIFRHQLPEYEISVAAFRDPADFGTQWWTRRRWAANFWRENLKFLWFTIAYRWRARTDSPGYAGRVAQR